MKLQAVRDAPSDQNFRAIEREFPLQGQNIADEAVGPSQLSTAAEQLFLQLVTPATRKVNFSSVEVEWNVKGIASAAATVTHGLGATPKAVAPVAGSFSGSYAEVEALGATTFKVRLVSTTGEIAAGTKRTVYWIAIG